MDTVLGRLSLPAFRVRLGLPETSRGRLSHGVVDGADDHAVLEGMAAADRDHAGGQRMINLDSIDGMKWLHAAIPLYFPNSTFRVDEISTCKCCEGEMIGLVINGSFEVKDFRSRRHKFCEAIRAFGYDRLYKAISIYQREGPL